jgi:hypothetical protein
MIRDVSGFSVFGGWLMRSMSNRVQWRCMPLAISDDVSRRLLFDTGAKATCLEQAA